MRILAIETSCDETAIAFVEARGDLKNPRFKIVKNLVASQIKIHQPFGGVVPNLAKREHLKNLPILFKKLVASGYTPNPNIIAVTVGPGLEPALWTGINFSKEVYKNLKTKLIGVNHLEGHLYSFLLSQKKVNTKYKILNPKNLEFRVLNFEFPAIALLVSGGHTILVKIDSLEKYKKIGETRDDAAGEAFDKVARLLGLPYPGGPEIEKMAKRGSPEAIKFPRPMLSQKNFDFSFSGLKTAVLYYLFNEYPLNFAKKISAKPKSQFKIKKKSNGSLSIGRDLIDINRLADIAASFQKAAFDVLIKKTLRAAEKFEAKSIFISGGVAANKTLQKEFQRAIANLQPHAYRQAGTTYNLQPNLYITKYPTDNAAMIAAAGYINYLRKKNRRLIANGNLNI